MRSCICAHRIDGETSVRSAIGAHRRRGESMRSDISTHRTLVRPAITALTVRPAIAALTGY